MILPLQLLHFVPILLFEFCGAGDTNGAGRETIFLEPRLEDTIGPVRILLRRAGCAGATCAVVFRAFDGYLAVSWTWAVRRIRWILYGAASPPLCNILCVLSQKIKIPSDTINGGFISSNAFPNIRGVFASLNGGRFNSSPYCACSVSAVNRDIGDTVSRYNV